MIFIVQPQPVFSVGQLRLDFLFTDSDLVFHLVALQLADDHFLADIFTECGKTDAFTLESLTKGLKLHVILPCDIVDNLVELFVIDPDITLLRQLQLDLLQDHAFENLPAQHILGGQLGIPFLQALFDLLDPGIQFAGGYDIPVDDGDNPVEFHDSGIGPTAGGAGQHEKNCR